LAGTVRPLKDWKSPGHYSLGKKDVEIVVKNSRIVI
jgi:hypothetical protein